MQRERAVDREARAPPRGARLRPLRRPRVERRAQLARAGAGADETSRRRARSRARCPRAGRRRRRAPARRVSSSTRSRFVSATTAVRTPSSSRIATCSRVCGMTPSSQATTSSARSMPVAPRSSCARSARARARRRPRASGPRAGRGSRSRASIEMPRACSSGRRSVSTPVSARTSAVLPWSMCPAVPSVSARRSRHAGALMRLGLGVAERAAVEHERAVGRRGRARRVAGAQARRRAVGVALERARRTTAARPAAARRRRRARRLDDAAADARGERLGARPHVLGGLEHARAAPGARRARAPGRGRCAAWPRARPARACRCAGRAPAGGAGRRRSHRRAGEDARPAGRRAACRPRSRRGRAVARAPRGRAARRPAPGSSSQQRPSRCRRRAGSAARVREPASVARPRTSPGEPDARGSSTGARTGARPCRGRSRAS